MNSTIKQLISSLAFSIPVSIILANAAHSQTITPQTKPDCAKVVCTTDGAELKQHKWVTNSSNKWPDINPKTRWQWKKGEFKCRPKATFKYSTEKLEKMGMFGVCKEVEK